MSGQASRLPVRHRINPQYRVAQPNETGIPPHDPTKSTDDRLAAALKQQPPVATVTRPTSMEDKPKTMTVTDIKTVKTSAAAAAASVSLTPQQLRAQLQAELENRAKTCSYSGHRCSLPRVAGHQYCMNHILKDPRAPYRQCSFVYTSNGKRCPNAAPKLEMVKHNSYCFEHSRQAQRVRSRTMGRWMPARTLDTTLAQLSHYLTPAESTVYNPNAAATGSSGGTMGGGGGYHPYHHQHQGHQGGGMVATSDRFKKEPIKKDVRVKTDENGRIVPLDPMTELNVDLVERSRSALCYASESDSDCSEPVLYGDVNQSAAFLGSDDEFTEDASTDPLKHAGIYTAEEANSVIREKLARLQTLYVEQFRMLHQELKIKRAKLMPALRREQETLCSVHDQPKETPRELHLFKKLKAYKRYQKKTGLEAVLHERSLERRAKQMDGGGGHQTPSAYGVVGGGGGGLGVNRPQHHGGAKCIYIDGGVKCAERPVPCSKYCRRHILQDKRQILFKPCGVELGGVVCQEPITGLLEIDTCPLHYRIPEPRTYNIRKESSDSERTDDEELSNANPDSPRTESSTAIQQPSNAIKQEIIPDIMDTTTTEDSAVSVDSKKSFRSSSHQHDAPQYRNELKRHHTNVSTSYQHHNKQFPIKQEVDTTEAHHTEEDQQQQLDEEEIQLEEEEIVHYDTETEIPEMEVEVEGSPGQHQHHYYTVKQEIIAHSVNDDDIDIEDHHHHDDDYHQLMKEELPDAAAEEEVDVADDIIVTMDCQEENVIQEGGQEEVGDGGEQGGDVSVDDVPLV